MEIVIVSLFGILILIIIYLLIRLTLMRKGADEIKQAFHERLNQDTNTLITISTHDAHMRQLAADINTELKQLRKLRHHYEQGDLQLKAAVTNISHDLRTPLTAMCGYLDLLEQAEMSEEDKRMLAIIKGRCDVLKQLIEELFAYTSGTAMLITHPQLEAVNLNRFLEECLASYYAAFKKRQITPKITITKQPITRCLDKQALSRVIENILGNALKYSSGDLIISLSDNGVISFTNHTETLDEVMINQLFDRFYTVQTGGDSMGLSLSIAKELVKQMHGTIDAVCEKQMLTIRIQFPV